MEIEIKWDPVGEEKTEKFDEYDKWQFAQRIVLSESEGGMTWHELEECFGTRSTCDIFRMNYLDARERYIAWRKKKKEDEIHVGDEVKTFEGTYIKMIVTKITKNAVDGISFDGQVHTRFKNKVKKTGRRFTDLTDLLKDYDSLDAVSDIF